MQEIAAPSQEGVQPAQTPSLPQKPLLLAQLVQEVAVPVQAGVEVGVQPGQAEQLRLPLHCWHDEYVGVPWQVGATLNWCGGVGNTEGSSLQQI